MLLDLKQAINVFKNLSNRPVPTLARFLDTSPITIASKWNILDVEHTKKVHFEQTFFSTQENSFISSPPTEVDYTSRVYSPSSKQSALLLNKKVSGEDEQSFEIWNEIGLKKVYNVKKFDHGKVHPPSAYIGSIRFSPDGKHILYIAEKKQKEEKNPYVDNEDDKSRKNFEFQESFGEQMGSFKQTVLCILNIETGECKIVDVLPSAVTIGIAEWNLDNKSVICIAWKTLPYKLGLIYCPMRCNCVYSINLDENRADLLFEDENLCTLFPRITKEKIYCLQSKTGGEHCRTARLAEIDIKSKSLRVIVDVVDQPHNNGFPGLSPYVVPPSRCFSKNGDQLHLSSLWGCDEALLSINLQTRSVKRIPAPEGFSSVSVLDVRDDVLLCICSAMNQIPVLGICRVEDNEWSLINPPKPLNFTVERKTFKAKFEGKSFAPKEFNGLLVKPENFDSKSTPLILSNHGGPHSCFTTAYREVTAALAISGFGVLEVNYRGSLGQGENSIRSLPGLCGKQDVLDIKQALDEVLKEDGFNKEKLLVMGGSHGGFLTVHLIGQFPDLFKAAICRNPVINIATMVHSSDIPDWTFIETGYERFDFKNLGDPEVYKKMFECSPIKYVDNIRTPLLIALGEKDRRVPWRQGHELRRSLLARGACVKTLVYPDDCHPLDSADAQCDSFVQFYDWFYQHLQS
ncbi:DgyrCDS4166 [Dimorphilus gyrociliatus]|uniref:acylaminoacyl-peptidase n=1 Tax=Dimorphilus gyrociliatus TaxID=2664684 RepID=A0A7I8VFN2_9ANNE|nr:DgyrCDS4166 [Dimorphilus gyrociliatus]